MKSAKIAQYISKFRRLNVFFVVVVMFVTTPFFIFASGPNLTKSFLILVLTVFYCGVFEAVAWCWEVVFRDKAEYEAERDSKDR